MPKYEFTPKLMRLDRLQRSKALAEVIKEFAATGRKPDFFAVDLRPIYEQLMEAA